MKHFAIVLAVFSLFVLFVTCPVFAATIHVPGNQYTIQAGINAARDGDIVLVAPGTYVEYIDFMGKAITLQSEKGVEVTFIEGSKSAVVVVFTRGEDNESVIDGFTVRNGEGGIYCLNSSPTVINCRIVGNRGSRGAGIACRISSSPVITNCTISENETNNTGGGISCVDKSSPTFANCLISGNIAQWGGGIYCSDESSPKIKDCQIDHNSATEGGGIYFERNSWLTVITSEISGNKAGVGSALYAENKSKLKIIEPSIITGTAYIDYDVDGYSSGEDCDDENRFVNPGVEESKKAVNVRDGIDNDCDGVIDEAPCFLGAVI